MTLSLWVVAFLWDVAPTGGIATSAGPAPGRPLRRGCFGQIGTVPLTLGHLGLYEAAGSDLDGVGELDEADRVIGEASDWIDHPEAGICRVTFRAPSEHPPSLLGIRRLGRPTDSHLSIGYTDDTPDAEAVERGEIYELSIVDVGGFMETRILADGSASLDAVRAGVPLNLRRVHGRRIA